ncbi:unnamed protein product [Protopolystoma xenopodis]|uniref:Uncharacterized protein n=1 Tax=Protopolystoma xenopodis TaxID=117903 RepID=A0A3S5AW74_9PLAT|nr:unnamed protein product [Protopolystoma xenopodis]
MRHSISALELSSGLPGQPGKPTPSPLVGASGPHSQTSKLGVSSPTSSPGNVTAATLSLSNAVRSPLSHSVVGNSQDQLPLSSPGNLFITGNEATRRRVRAQESNMMAPVSF